MFMGACQLISNLGPMGQVGTLFWTPPPMVEESNGIQHTLPIHSSMDMVN
jgi:hypothetical protein